MKKITIAASLLLLSGLSAQAQTATDFTANDCAGTSHHLFDELNSGKVVVVSFVMPCGNCIGPSLSAQSTVHSYAGSHPNRVVFYIADDVANTTCADLTSWEGVNSLTPAASFSSGAFVATQYGAVAMPKIVVLAGNDHHVYYSEDNGLNATNFQNAINSALVATAVPQVKTAETELSIFPNPASGNISVTYSLAAPADVSFDIIDIIGTKVQSVTLQKQAAGNHEQGIKFNGKLSNGVYVLQLTAGDITKSVKFTVAH